MKYRRFETWDKYWEIKREGKTIYRRWGPIGQSTKRKKDTLPSVKVATEFLEDLIRRRRGRGYRETETR